MRCTGRQAVGARRELRRRRAHDRRSCGRRDRPQESAGYAV